MKHIIRRLFRANSSETTPASPSLPATEIEEIQALLDRTPLEFKPFFAARVMHRLQQTTEEVHGIWVNVPLAFKWVVGPAMTLIIGLIVLSLAGGDSLSFESLLGIQEVYLDDLYYEFSTE